MNWLKHNPLLHKLVDKVEVKKYVSEKIGSQYVIPSIGQWNTVSDIDFDSLPNEFVIKCTHDSGSVFICCNKSNVEIEKIKNKLL